MVLPLHSGLESAIRTRSVNELDAAGVMLGNQGGQLQVQIGALMQVSMISQTLTLRQKLMKQYEECAKKQKEAQDPNVKKMYAKQMVQIMSDLEALDHSMDDSKPPAK